jgi:hypothetical protein
MNNLLPCPFKLLPSQPFYDGHCRPIPFINYVPPKKKLIISYEVELRVVSSEKSEIITLKFSE